MERTLSEIILALSDFLIDEIGVKGMKYVEKIENSSSMEELLRNIKIVNQMLMADDRENIAKKFYVYFYKLKGE